MEEKERESIKAVVKEAIDEKAAEFWVEREKHWRHHEFLERLINLTDKAQNAMINSFLAALVIGILTLIVLGALGYFKAGGKP